MAVDPQILKLMRQTVTINHMTSFNANGEPQYAGSAVTYTARVVNSSRLIRDLNGQDQVASNVVFLATNPSTFSLYDKITLPDGQTPVIFTIETYPDEKGNLFTVLLTGFAKAGDYVR